MADTKHVHAAPADAGDGVTFEACDDLRFEDEE